MKRIGLYCLLIIIGIVALQAQELSDDTIHVGCMERVKNLNPYLAQSEVELTLQQLVFPPLIADCGRRGNGNSPFIGILIADRNILEQGNSNSLRFGLGASRLCPDLTITPREIIANVERLKQLAGGSNFAFNLVRAQAVGQHAVDISFSTRERFGKLTSAAFPIINFEKIRGSGYLDKWNRNNKIFISQEDSAYLLGYSDYRYRDIFKRQNTITLAPKPGIGRPNAKILSLKTFPDYNQLVRGLIANEIQVAMNVSPLTYIGDKDIAWADEQFGRKSVLYLEVTDRGRRIGLDTMNMALIELVRTQFKRRFAQDNLISNSGWVHCYQGLLNETLENITAAKPRRLKETEIRLLYTRNTINDRVVRILQDIFSNIETENPYTLSVRGVSQSISIENIDTHRFHLIMGSRFINTPEFLNLRFYLKHPEARRFKREIDNILDMGGQTSRLNTQAMQLEPRILDRVPLVFLVRYNTRIAYRHRNVKRNIDSDKGSPYFFYNLSGWGITNERPEQNHKK